MKPCPFCGGIPDYIQSGELHYVRCDDCLAQVDYCDSESDAVSKWNQRADNKITLRDQFAMAALTGLLANNDSDLHEGEHLMAYRIADAMMKQREGK
jgi:Lar family restriction alleviation protein